MSDDPEFVRYRIEAATVDGRPMPPGEAEFRIVGRLVPERFEPWSSAAADARFRIQDWAGPYPPQDVVFEHRAVLVSGRMTARFWPVRGTYAEALTDAQSADSEGAGVWYCESRVAHGWKRAAMVHPVSGEPV